MIPLTDNLSSLSTPLHLGHHTAPNRIAIQPMEGCDCTADGSPTEMAERRYLRFARGIDLV